jgi:hypothetical protein
MLLARWTLEGRPNSTRQRGNGHLYGRVAKCICGTKKGVKGHIKPRERLWTHKALRKAKCGRCPKRSHMLPLLGEQYSSGHPKSKPYPIWVINLP